MFSNSDKRKFFRKLAEKGLARVKEEFANGAYNSNIHHIRWADEWIQYQEMNFLNLMRAHLRRLFWHSCPLGAWSFIRNKPIIVFQHGKVGSTAIAGGFAKMNTRVHKTHFFSEYLELRHIKKAISKGVGGWKVITLCRDPIAMKISHFFQNLNNQYKQEKGYVGAEDYVKKMTPSELENIFLQQLHEEDNKQGRWPLCWFYDYLQKIFGVNIFDHPFDKAEGYGIYKTKQAEILLIRYEDLRSKGAQAINDFLGITEYQLVDDNVSTDKYYSNQYDVFKRNIKLPEEIVKEIYLSKEMRCLYTNHEIQEFAAKWRVNLDL